MSRIFRHKIAFVVPTMNRPFELRRMLESVRSQSVLPDEIVIVDGGTDSIENICHEFTASLTLKYVRVFPPSLAKQRNAGMAVIGDSIAVAGYLDDDLVLEDGSMEEMLAFWDKAGPDIGGASFNIVNDRIPRGILIKSLFSVDSRRRGAVLKSGYQAMIGAVREDHFVDWLFGGATVWRREVLNEFQYDEWYQGTGYLEDLDYSYRVSRKYKLIVLAGARVQHLSPPVRKSRNYLMGKWQVINRMYFISKHRDLSKPLFYWATFGLIIANVAEGVLTRNMGLFVRAWGNLVGLTKVSVSGVEQIGGYLK